MVVAQIGIGVVRNHQKENHHWKPEQITSLDGHIERRIVHDAYRPLHPVNDAAAVFQGRASATHLYTRLVSQPGKFFRDLRVVWDSSHLHNSH
jgi:hypothetical protein